MISLIGTESNWLTNLIVSLCGGGQLIQTQLLCTGTRVFFNIIFQNTPNPFMVKNSKHEMLNNSTVQSKSLMVLLLLDHAEKQHVSPDPSTADGDILYMEKVNTWRPVPLPHPKTMMLCCSTSLFNIQMLRTDGDRNHVPNAGRDGDGINLKCALQL